MTDAPRPHASRLSRDQLIGLTATIAKDLGRLPYQREHRLYGHAGMGHHVQAMFGGWAGLFGATLAAHPDLDPGRKVVRTAFNAPGRRKPQAQQVIPDPDDTPVDVVVTEKGLDAISAAGSRIGAAIIRARAQRDDVAWMGDQLRSLADSVNRLAESVALIGRIQQASSLDIARTRAVLDQVAAELELDDPEATPVVHHVAMNGNGHH